MLVSALLGTLLVLVLVLPLAWKWNLGLRRVAVAAVGLGLLASLLVALLGSVVAIPATLRPVVIGLLALALAFAALAYRFYRDPERTAPDRDDVVVSPADGEVLYVHRSRSGTLPVATKNGRGHALEELTRTPLQTAEAVVIGIGMSFLDVHVNRAPIGGRVTLQRHFPGRFGSLRRPEMVFENERATTVLERGDLQVAVVQIASRLVRQIAVFVREGQEVAMAQRIGVIRLGSQVDLALPARHDLRVTVRPGERVRAGESVVAVLDRPGARAADTLGQ